MERKLMASAELEQSEIEQPRQSTPVFVLEALCELALLAIMVLSLTDHTPLPPGYKITMVVVALAVLALLVARRSELLLRPEAALVTAVALGLILTTARSRNVGEVEFFANPPWWGVKVSWAGLIASGMAAIYLVRSAAERFRNLARNPYAASLIVAVAAMAAVEMALAVSVRRAGATLLLDTPCAFASLAVQFLAIAILCSSVVSTARARRLALLALIGLALKVVLAKSGV